MVRLITDFEVTSPIQSIGLVWPFPSGTGIANLHYPTLRVGISTSIKNLPQQQRTAQEVIPGAAILRGLGVEVAP